MLYLIFLFSEAQCNFRNKLFNLVEAQPNSANAQPYFCTKSKRNVTSATIGVARIFDWGGQNHNDVIRNFRKENFLWDRDIVDWKIRSRGLCVGT